MDSEFLHHEPCPRCGSSDNLARYSDGHAHCFSMGCDYFEKADGQDAEASKNKTKGNKRVSKDLIPIGDPSEWESRGIDLETAKKWGFTRTEYKGQVVRSFNYKDLNGSLVAQKVRFKGKDFKFLGDTKAAGLFGMHLWRDHGKKIVVTTGELDAMSVSKVQNHKWPVVSVKNGDSGAKKDIQACIDWLERFEEVILMFDQDESGRKAVEQVAPVFSPGKVKIAKLPLKDANAMLMDGRGAEIIDAIFGAKEFRPDGIVSINDLIDEAAKPPEWGLPWWSQKLTTLTYGRRFSETYALGAGTGVGKTDFLTQQISYDATVLHEPVGLFFLEQKPVETAKRIAGKIAGKSFHIPDGDWEIQELTDALCRIENVHFYDNFGAADWDVIASHIRFLHHAHGVRIFYVDHLTALADPSSERESLEEIMKSMASLANELNVIITFVSHLSTPDGKPHEEGGRVQIRHFKGSRAIGFWSHFMFGMERDQQAEAEDERQTTTFRVLKDRYTGRSAGETFYLGFENGQLFEKEVADKSPFPERDDIDDDDDDEIPF